MFLDGPDSCHAIVSCSLSEDGSSIVVSLDDPTERRCVESYLFELGQENRTSSVDKSSSVFSTDTIFGSTHLNQKVYTLDAEGRRGEEPCLFSITGELSYLEDFAAFILPVFHLFLVYTYSFVLLELLFIKCKEDFFYWTKLIVGSELPM